MERRRPAGMATHVHPVSIQANPKGATRLRRVVDLQRREHRERRCG